MVRRFLCGSGVSMLAAGALLALPAGALASSVKIGSTFTASGGFTPPITFVVVSTASGSPKYVVPKDGSRITAFSMQAGASTTSRVKLKVMRKTATAGTWTVIGQSSAVTLTPNVLNKFATSVVVHAGDVLGLTDVSTTGNAPAIGAGFSTGDVLGEASGDSAVGSSYTPASDSPGGFRLNLAATVQLRPVVTLIKPTSGPAAGGTTVTITGRNFSGATAVKFGTVPATSFKIVSATQITAVAPKGTAGATVDVRVSSAGGPSVAVAVDHYKYT
jgi:hypothetical protein